MTLELRRVSMPLTGFDLEIDTVLEEGVAAIFGPSGSGKTSLLDLICGLRRPRSAFIQLDGAVLTDTARNHSTPSRSRGIGYVPQDRALFPHLSVRQNVLFGARGADRMFSLSHVAGILEIDWLLDRGIGNLSGGERQRVALARALLSEPRILLLDEPLAGLDDALKEKAVGLLLRVRAEFGLPMIYVSHTAEEIAVLCDEVIVLERGRVARHGSPSAIFERTSLPTLRLKENGAASI